MIGYEYLNSTSPSIYGTRTFKYLEYENYILYDINENFANWDVECCHPYGNMVNGLSVGK